MEPDKPPNGDYGNWARDRGIARARGSHLWFMDDDDKALPGALDAMRARIEEDPTCIWVFRVKTGAGSVLWNEKRKAVGNYQGQCFLIPREKCPSWVESGTDWRLSDRLYAQHPWSWAEEVVAECGPWFIRNENPYLIEPISP
jgi:glycosyltransferase involved in cell wall biosynthesis